jgi:D-alanine-D-alanine ligase-like ATP-grasp enzyme
MVKFDYYAKNLTCSLLTILAHTCLSVCGSASCSRLYKGAKKSEIPMIFTLTNNKQKGRLQSMIIELIRKQIKTCGKSRYEISRQTGIEEAVLCRILQGGSCKAETVEALLEYFGFEIVRKKVKAKKGKVKKCQRMS